MVVLTKTLRWREVLSLGVPMFSLSLTHPGQVDDRKLTVNVSLLGLLASITVDLSLVLGCYKCINLWIGHLMDLGTALWDGFPTNPIAYSAFAKVVAAFAWASTFHSYTHPQRVKLTREFIYRSSRGSSIEQVHRRRHSSRKFHERATSSLIAFDFENRQNLLRQLSRILDSGPEYYNSLSLKFSAYMFP